MNCWTNESGITITSEVAEFVKSFKQVASATYMNDVNTEEDPDSQQTANDDQIDAEDYGGKKYPNDVIKYIKEPILQQCK